MICRPDRLIFRVCAGVVLLALASCGAPETTMSAFEEGMAALGRGDGVAAEVALRQAMNDGVPRARVAAALGEAEMLQGQLPEARSWLEAGEFDADSRVRGFQMLGRLEMQSGNLPAAGTAFDRALAEGRQTAGLWVDIGRLRYAGGEQVQAIEAAEHAVDLDPVDPSALRFRGQLVRDSYGLAASVPWFEAALNKAPTDIGLMTDLAATLADLGRAKEALPLVRKIAELDPGNRDIYVIQAVIAARGGQFSLARSLLQRSGNLENEVPAAMLLSGLIDLENRNYSSAAQTFDRLTELQPDNARVRSLLARSLALGRSYPELAHRFAAVAERPDGSRYIAMLVGRAYEKTGEREKAAIYLDLAAGPMRESLAVLPGIENLAVAQERGSNSGRDVVSLVRGLIMAGNPARAQEVADRFSNRFGGSADALSLAGDAQLAAKDKRTALDRYLASANVRRSWSLTKKMIRTMRASGRQADADALLEQTVRSNPDNREAVGQLARVYAARGEWEAAAILLDHAMTLGGDRDPELLALLSQAEAKLGDDDLAATTLERARAIMPLRMGR